MATPAVASPILYQNADCTITLIDVPCSIAAAQDTLEQACRDTLMSSKPLEQPFPTAEPSTAAAKAKLLKNTVDSELHAQYHALLEAACTEIRAAHSEPWCHLRPFVDERLRVAEKRKRSPEPSVDQQHAQHIRIPPGSSFLLGDCKDSHVLHTAVKADAKTKGTRRAFDFILLDPPWPNASVKRTGATAARPTYTVVDTLADARDLLLDTQLDVLMADGCLVGMWITNKPGVRELVLGEEGVFACWGVELVEEWIWLKTTLHGAPVSPLRSAWRKPYEVLLLGRKRRRGSCVGSTSDSPPAHAKRRVLVGVPDLHSRKPCLKLLVEPLMPDARDYRALEVFARYLVADWWSWGNECTKFNWEGYWRRADFHASPLDTAGTKKQGGER